MLHRVTYVERPALMGFGRGAVTRTEAEDDIRGLRDQVNDLNRRVAALQRVMTDNMDQLLLQTQQASKQNLQRAVHSPPQAQT